jgi:hypothetical protein
VRRGRGPARAHWAAAMAATALGWAVAGCGVPHPGISNDSVSACFRAIPAARNAINDPSARMVSLHRVVADKVVPSPLAPPTTVDLDTEVCAVVFEGTFSSGQVDLAPAGQQGHYAVVLVASKNLRLVAAYVVDQPPPHLGIKAPKT